jgi:ribosomal-protein-alanine N-acetyltransferase
MRREDLDEVAALDAMVSNPAWSRPMFETELTTNQFAAFLVARALDVGTRAANSEKGSSDAPTPPATLVAPSAAGTLCGYVGFWIVFEELHLLNVAVHPTWRRQGIAHRLVQMVFEQARASGVIRALLEVRASNEAAQRLYERFGFRVVSRRVNYYTQPTEDALMMGCEMRDAG